MSIGILTIVRDGAIHLPRFFDFLEQLESFFTKDNIYVSFYENDSSDQTGYLIDLWLEKHNGSLISEYFHEKPLKGIDLHRTKRLAYARNKALEPLLQRNTKWLIIVDVDLKVDLNHVLQLIDLLNRNKDAAMICASTMQNVPDIFGESFWSYYDSWALKDLEGNRGITFAFNPFRNRRDRWRWMSGLTVRVNSAFGGMALLNSSTIRKYNIRWDGNCGCEHWHFCSEVRKAGNVLVSPLVNPILIHSYPAPSWGTSYASKMLKEILN